MKRHPTLAAALAAPLAACAAAAAGGGDEPLPPGANDPSQVAVFYMGQHPQCGMVRITEVQAQSVGDLRWAALSMHGNAVVGVRSSLVVPEQSRWTYRRGVTGPAAYRVYSGTVVRLNDRCTI